MTKKTESEIMEEIEKVRKDINKEYNKFLEYERMGFSVNARVHYEDHLRLMGFRDGLQWVLRDEKRIKDQSVQ